MKKPIRFNLQFHNGEESVQIRNLDDLEENMNLNDLLDSFLSGDLERWLIQRSETDRAKLISYLEHNDDEETLFKLFEALDLGFPESEIKDIVGCYIHQKAVAQARSMISASAEEIRESDVSISNDPQIKVFNTSRFEEYKQLKEQIKSLDKYQLPAYKPLIDVLISDYPDYFEIDCVNFYYEMYEAKCPLAILTLLMNSKWKSFYEGICFPKQERSVRAFYVGYNHKDAYQQTLPVNRTDVMSLVEVNRCLPFITAGYNRPKPYLFFWEETEDGKLLYSDLIDNANEMRDNPEKPFKWIDNNSNVISDNWKRLLPKEKKVLIVHRGANLQIQFDSDPANDSFNCGLKCYRSGYRNCLADNVLIFLPFD